MIERPDLTGYHLLHRGMRVDTARLQGAVADLTEADRPGRAPALARWYAGFLGEFRHHHTVEDEIFFPALAARVPEFRDQTARLDGEHHRLEGALVAVEAAVGSLTDAHLDWHARHRAANDAVTAAGIELNLHLDFEDACVLPLFVEHMSVAEFDELEKRAAKSLPRSQLKFSVPWLVGQATGNERRQLLGGAPLLLKLAWYVTRRRYARLAERALGGTSPPQPGRAAPG